MRKLFLAFIVLSFANTVFAQIDSMNRLNTTMPNSSNPSTYSNMNAAQLDSMRNTLPEDRSRVESMRNDLDNARMRRDASRTNANAASKMRIDSMNNMSNGFKDRSQKQTPPEYNDNNPKKRMRSDTMRNGRFTNEMQYDTVPKRYRKNRKNTLPTTTMRSDTTMPINKVRAKMDKNATGGMSEKMGEREKIMPSSEKQVMMQNGKVVMMKNGKSLTVKAYTPLSNGTKVMSDGTVMKKDGSKTMLKEGECLNMAGEMVEKPAKMK